MDEIIRKKVKVNVKNDITFHVMDWDILDKAEDEDEGYSVKKCFLRMFGVSAEGYSVMCEISGFTPFFYIEIPNSWNMIHVKKFVYVLKNKVPTYFQYSLKKYEIVKRIKFMGFTNKTKFKFVRLIFDKVGAFYKFRKILENSISIPSLNIKKKFNLYESNLDPLLKYIHIRDLLPSGLVTVSNYKLNKPKISTCQIDISTDWKNVSKCEEEQINPILIASFDIECNSVHSTKFPQAKPSYNYIKELKDELLNLWRTVIQTYLNNIDKYEKEFPIRKYILDLELEIEGFLENNDPLPLKFTVDEKYKINRIKNKMYHDDVYKLINGYLYTDISKIVMNYYSTPLINFISNLQTQLRKEINERVIIGNEYNGDEVIQIGTTISKYGSSDIICKHIVVLNSCDEIKGSIVESYDTEKEVLLAWTNFITKLDPDVITGYNIFGFDFKYMYERAEVLECEEEFSKLSRIDDEICPLKEMFLSSSAMGQNVLYYIPMKGRVIIDLYKVIQREYKLPSYTLNNVASKFIGKNKNDIKPWQIFKLFKGDSNDRMVLAEYCIQDCILCNLLMDKLNILVNNISMANVCYVPLSYIFFRGQGIKIHSLVARECRKEGYVIKSINKKDDFKPAKGAIVFEPEIGYYMKPVFVCDFNSLYPSCMISENLSHDCLVKKGSKYDNIEGIEYKDIEYEYTDGSTDVARFAQLPEKGIIPRILDMLLSERKNVKKRMKKEADPFLASLLNGRQLSLKITANSIYGQTGSNVSKIRCVAIAGCTTATGRYLLSFSRDYVEKHYKHVGAKCIYGDSVLGNTLILVKKDEMKILRISELGRSFKKYGSKEFGYSDYKVWTEEGWQGINKVIKHRTNKKIYHISTNNGMVDVTEDHSLVNDKLQKVKPNECIIGKTKLLQSLPNSLNTYDFDVEGAYDYIKQFIK